MVRRKRKNNDVVLRIPSWTTKVYIFMAAVLLPWTVYIGLTLPRHHLSANWDVSWTGLDIGLVASLVATGLFAYLQSVWIVISSATTGSLLLVDAWFDVMSQRSSVSFRQALIMAFVFELPLALLSYYLATHALRHNTRRRK